MKRGAKDCGVLVEFEEVRRRLRLGTRRELGRHEVSVAEIIGSVSRAHEFDGCFRPRTQRLRKMLHEIRSAKPDAADMPIRVYQVDHAYFVEDGHKRLALAIEEGRTYIDADVWSYATRFHLARGTTIDKVRLTEAEVRFREVTGLDQAVPAARFPLADPDAYLELAESVKAHAYDLSSERGYLVPPSEAARHWYDLVFAPSAQLARDAGIPRLLSSCSEAELFLLLRRGINQPFDPGWRIPETAARRGRRNLVAAEPRGVSAQLSSLVRGARPRPDVLHDEAAARADVDLAVGHRQSAPPDVVVADEPPVSLENASRTGGKEAH